MNTTVTAYTREWLRARKLGSSDAAAVLGLNPYRTPYQVWSEKTGVGKPVEETEPMHWGKLLESTIAEEFAVRTGFTIERNEAMATHADYDFMTATIDYLCWDNNNELGILEIKNVNAFTRDYDSENVADSTQIQVMHQMACTGFKWAYVAYLIGGNKLQWQLIHRDDQLIAKIIEAEAKFWKLVETNTPPPMAGGDNDLLAGMYPKATQQSIELPGAAELAAGYLAAKAEAKAAESRADDYAAKLKGMIGCYESATAGMYRVSWKNQVRKSYVVSESQFRKFDIKELK